MKRPINNLFTIFTIAILITASSCNQVPATVTIVPSVKFITTIVPAAISTATQPPSTHTPTATVVVTFPPNPRVLPFQRNIISAGGDHTCAITLSGGVKCWGNNGSGQLGDGTINPSSTPVSVVGLDRGITSVATAELHTCALTASGGVKCWGYNGYGQLGDGTTKGSLIPVDVAGLSSGVVAVAVGELISCALMAAGGVKCWGLNKDGQLGDGTANDHLTPVDVIGLGSAVAAVSVGGTYTCALTNTGGVKCWGDNTFGQLGDGTTDRRFTPVDVMGLNSGVATVSAGGNHTCALTIAGGVKCWGWNGYGQLGDGTFDAVHLTPVDVVGLSSGIAAVSAEGTYTCALTVAGGAKCWGDNTSGQLGDGTTTNNNTPVDVVGLVTGAIAITVSHFHTCALMASSGVKCWGNNQYGQLGDGIPPICLTPVDVVGLSSGVLSVEAGAAHTCSLTASGEVMCWGASGISQQGDGTPNDTRSTSVNAAGLGIGVRVVAAGGDHTCVLTGAGGVKCWGDNASGQLGDGTTNDHSTPVDVVGLGSEVTSVTAGYLHTCVLTVLGGVECWGLNASGELGDGTTIYNRSAPVDVVGLSTGVTAITAGGDYTCALVISGKVKCWGGNYYGQLGNGNTTDSNTPVDVVGLGSNIIAVSAGHSHTCALTSSGGVKCWGDNLYGQLGDGTTSGRSTPVNVSGLDKGIVAVTAGGVHTCALTVSGGLKCWGNNKYGQLGDGTTVQRLTPVDEVGLVSGVTAVTAGEIHTCVLTTSGGVKCWGSDLNGQMGDSRMLWSTVPVDVVK